MHTADLLTCSHVISLSCVPGRIRTHSGDTRIPQICDVLSKAHGPRLVWGRGEIISQQTRVWVLRSLEVTPKEDKMVGPWSLSLLMSSFVVGVLLCGGGQSNQGLEPHKLWTKISLNLFKFKSMHLFTLWVDCLRHFVVTPKHRWKEDNDSYHILAAFMGSAALWHSCVTSSYKGS